MPQAELTNPGPYRQEGSITNQFIYFKKALKCAFTAEPSGMLTARERLPFATNMPAASDRNEKQKKRYTFCGQVS